MCKPRSWNMLKKALKHSQLKFFMQIWNSIQFPWIDLLFMFTYLCVQRIEHRLPNTCTSYARNFVTDRVGEKKKKNSRQKGATKSDYCCWRGWITSINHFKLNDTVAISPFTHLNVSPKTLSQFIDIFLFGMPFASYPYPFDTCGLLWFFYALLMHNHMQTSMCV